LEGHAKNMSKAIIFCHSPHVAGTIGEISRDVASALKGIGMEVFFIASCEPVSYFEKVDGMGYPIVVDGEETYCSCGAENIIVSIYEHVLSFNPDIFISIGERPEVELASAAIQVSGKSIRHIHLWTGSSEPCKGACEAMSRVSDLLCFGKHAKHNIENYVKNVCSIEIKNSLVAASSAKNNNLVLCGGPSSDISNLLCVIEAFSGIEMEIKIITNLYENGDYDVRGFAEDRNVTIDFGNDPYGTFYGLDNNSICKNASDSFYFVDMSIKQGSCYALDCAIRSGCLPILSRTPRHVEFLLSRDLDIDMVNAITIPTSKFRPSGGDCIWFADPINLNKIIQSLKEYEIGNGITRRLMEAAERMPTLKEEISKILQK